MSESRPYVLSIAGFDPSAGAGVLADVKTFEQHKVYGLSVLTANTIQTENKFSEIHWMNEKIILKSIEELFSTYPIDVVKVGIVSSLESLKSIVETIKTHNRNAKIVWDTVLRSSTGFSFLDDENKDILRSILLDFAIITPNYEEIVKLSSNQNREESAQELAQFCPVLLKGGHREGKKGVDTLFTADSVEEFLPNGIISVGKHGTGCILSSAIAANLALGFSLSESCRNAKRYIEKILNSNQTLLAYHVS